MLSPGRSIVYRKSESADQLDKTERKRSSGRKGTARFGKTRGARRTVEGDRVTGVYTNNPPARQGWPEKLLV
jgi:hypothetical protein